MRRYLALWFQRIWQRRGIANLLLYPLSLVYIFGISMRRYAYKLGLRKPQRLAVPVVVVGNLSVGGVGKTPLVIALVEYLKHHGRKPGVIARGYRGISKHWPREVEATSDAVEVGDEPVLLFRRCEVPVVADPLRVRGARLLVEKHNCDIIVSDDGFQHFGLHRDLDIVVLDGARRLKNGWCLPAGPLRELPQALTRADMVVTQGTAQSGEYAMQTRIRTAVLLDGSEIQDLKQFAGQTVHAVTGIGNPTRFFQQLRAYDIQLITHQYPDHHRFCAADFAAIGAFDALLMTEKDAVKCAQILSAAQAAKCWVVAQQITVAPDFWQEFATRIRDLKP